MIDFPVPVLGFAAWSGTGKTTLLSQVIPLLKSRGLRVALVKHAHHSFDIDHPGKDSHILRKAGANEVVIASRHRIAAVRETPGNRKEPRLIDILSIMQIDQLDLILIEGFKMEDIPKVELHRKSLNKPYLYPNDTNIIAVAEVSDSKVDRPGIESLDLEQPGKIAEFVERFMKQHPGRATVSRIDDEPQLCYASIN